jgi:protein TonB
VIEASVLETPPPPAPIPPEPEPLPRAQPPQAVVPPLPRPVPVRQPAPVAQQPTAMAPTETPTPAVVDPAPPTSDARTGTGSGESRMLAYDGALKLAYPRAAIRRHAQGTVLLHVLVDTDGRAQQIELSRSSGHRELDDAAREAVRRARFRPVLENGVAVPAWGLVPIEFRLDRA